LARTGRLLSTIRRRVSVLVWIGLAVSAAFAYFAVRNVKLGDTWDALRTSHYAWLAPALAMLAAAFFVRVVRWRSLFAPGRRPGVRPLATALFAGYLFNNLLPVRAGEALRIGALNKLTRIP
jgi:glycosyltransferase 2 family protein